MYRSIPHSWMVLLGLVGAIGLVTIIILFRSIDFERVDHLLIDRTRDFDGIDETDSIDWNTKLTATGVDSDFGVHTIDTKEVQHLTDTEILQQQLDEEKRKRIQAEKEADFAWKAAEARKLDAQNQQMYSEYSPLMEEVLVAPLPDPVELIDEPKEVLDQQPPVEVVNSPPIPSSGLPEGWNMEQWEYYGAQWLEQQQDNSVEPESKDEPEIHEDLSSSRPVGSARKFLLPPSVLEPTCRCDNAQSAATSPNWQ